MAALMTLYEACRRVAGSHLAAQAQPFYDYYTQMNKLDPEFFPFFLSPNEWAEEFGKWQENQRETLVG